jgi:hypothetical protein
MGGSNPIEDAGIALAPFTGVTSLLASGAATGAFNDIGGAKNAASNMQTAESEQAGQAAALETLTLQQPKTISPDNFLASKTNALANLRLGLASTVTGAGGAPSAVLSAPSLTGSGPGKNKLGS